MRREFTIAAPPGKDWGHLLYAPVVTVMLVAAGATMSDIDGRDSQALSQPGFLIEVEVMAVIPER